MNYSELIAITVTAQNNKPKYGETCNSCGWCCLTEVCSVGVELSGSRELPCKYMKTEGGKHTCGLAGVPEIRKQLAMGEGCDAKTSSEVMAELMEVSDVGSD